MDFGRKSMKKITSYIWYRMMMNYPSIYGSGSQPFLVRSTLKAFKNFGGAPN
jgi:hypothetical protein